MNELIDWLVGIEDRAARVYDAAATRLPEDSSLAGFCKHLSIEEREHYDLMLKAREIIRDRVDCPSIVLLTEEKKREIEGYFEVYEKSVSAGGFAKEHLLDLISSTEFSEWNDMFLYVVNVLKHEDIKYLPVAAKIQHHKKSIERFFRSQPECARYLARIKHLPDIWEEKILVVDDEEMILDVVATILENEGIIDRANNGAEGLRMLGEKYYSAIVTDFDMPVMDGREFYNAAVARYPNIKERFLFFTGIVSEERSSFFEKEKIRYLQKPSPLEEIRNAVVEIIVRKTAAASNVSATESFFR